MSMEHVEKIKCPACGAESDFVIWRSINTQLDPDTKEKVLSGELFRFKCPKCSEETNIVYDTLYHQMEDQIMISLVSDEENIDEATDSFDRIANGSLMPGVQLPESEYVLRIVRNQNQLREKVYIFNHGLDDRIIEVMKMVILSRLMKKQPDIRVAEMLLEINEGESENFAIRMEDGQWGVVPFQHEFYETIKNDISGLDDVPKEYIVDRNWAIKFLTSRASN